MPDVFNPDQYLESAFNSLEDYVKGAVDAYVKNGTTNVGLQVFNVVMDYPEADDPSISAELDRTLIHFAVDDLSPSRLGFGDGIVDSYETASPGPDPLVTITRSKAMQHEINFDVGIWASDKSGGATSRLRAAQMLHEILGTYAARVNCMTQTNGVEILSFVGGRMVVEKVNDIRMYRVVGSELIVRVFSREKDTAILVDREPDVEPEVVIDATLIVP